MTTTSLTSDPSTQSDSTVTESQSSSSVTVTTSASSVSSTTGSSESTIEWKEEWRSQLVQNPLRKIKGIWTSSLLVDISVVDKIYLDNVPAVYVWSGGTFGGFDYEGESYRLVDGLRISLQLGDKDQLGRGQAELIAREWYGTMARRITTELNVAREEGQGLDLTVQEFRVV